MEKTKEEKQLNVEQEKMWSQELEKWGGFVSPSSERTIVILFD